MGRKCEVSSCNNYQGYGPGAAQNVSFFSFPRSDALCSVWVDACRSAQATALYLTHGAEGFIKKKMCSDHFVATAFRDANKRHRGLLPDAVPVTSENDDFFDESDIEFVEDEDFFDWKESQITNNTSSTGASSCAFIGTSSAAQMCSPIVPPISPNIASIELPRDRPNDSITPPKNTQSVPQSGSSSSTPADLPRIDIPGTSGNKMVTSPNSESEKATNGSQKIPRYGTPTDPSISAPINSSNDLPTNTSVTPSMLPFEFSGEARILQLEQSLKVERDSKMLLKQKLKDSRRQMFVNSQASKRRLASSLKYKRLAFQMRSENRSLVKQKTANKRLGEQVRSNPVLFDSIVNANRKPHGRRYHPETKRFAAGTYLSGPRTYRYLQRTGKIILPHKNTVHGFNKHIRIEPGINQGILARMKKKAKRIKDKKYTITTICCDGMSVKAELTYCAKTDTFHGFPNDGIARRIEQNNPAKLATEAIVVMVSGLYKRFKQPIAYFLAHNSLDSGTQLKLIKQCIRAVRKSGYIPLVLTLDQCSTNLKMAREAGATARVPLIDIDGESIALIYDPPHLIKSARNALFKNNAVFNDMVAAFSHIKKLFEIDSLSALRLAPKLKNKNIELPPFAAMNVALATRTLSETCAIAMRYYVQTNELPENAIQTATFMEIHDKLFDVFNFKEHYADSVGKPFRAPITNNSCHMEFLSQVLVTLENMFYTVSSCTDIAKAADESKQLRSVQKHPHYIKGFISDINALKWLWDVLRTKFNCKHLATNPICQDCAENFFSEIRRRCGFNDAPNAFQFACAFKYAVVGTVNQKINVVNRYRGCS